MKNALKRAICLVLVLIVVFSFAGCRTSPVLEQKVYTSDGEVDSDNRQTDNKEDHTQQDTTLPPKVTTQNVSRQASQRHTSARPRSQNPHPNPQERPYNGSNLRSPKPAEPRSGNNPRRAPNNAPGVSKTPNAPNHVVDNRTPVKPDDLPENVVTVAAPGQASLYVEMLGGANRLLATSAHTKNGLAGTVFPDFTKVQGLWEQDGEAPMTDAQFQQLLAANPEAVFYIADAEYDVVQSFSQAQLNQLNQKGIYTVPLHPFNTSSNIRENVQIMAKVLGKPKGLPNVKNANEVAKDYIRWMEDISKGFGNTFSGPDKWNLDQAGPFGNGAEKVNSYSDEGQYTILINGFDDTVQTSRDQGVAYAETGYTHRNSPASFFLSLGGAANTATLVPDDGGIPYFPVVPTFMDLYGGSLNGTESLKTAKSRDKSNLVTGYQGNYIGESIKTILVDSADTYNKVQNTRAFQPTQYISGGYGYLSETGALVPSNIHGSDFRFVINPCGAGSWIEGSPEAPLEALWANELFHNGKSPDDAFQAVTEAIQQFYRDFYGVELTAEELNYIKSR